MQKTTNKAPWVKCTYRAENGIVNGYGVSVDLGDGNMPWPVGCHKVRGKWYLNDMITGFCLCSYKRMPNVGEIIQAMPIFIKNACGFYPRVVDVRVRELYRLHYSEKEFKCMCLRMGWHAKEN